MQAESPAAAAAPKLSVAEKLRIANEKADNEIAGDEFVVGDIVNAKPQGQSLFFEGVKRQVAAYMCITIFCAGRHCSKGRRQI